jgi:transcriptional regulator with XRE-family HTH domain
MNQQEGKGTQPSVREVLKQIAPASQEARALGAQIRRRRRHLGLNARQIAAAAGVSHTTVYRLELGLHVPRVGVLARLATACGVEPEALLGLSVPDRQADLSPAARWSAAVRDLAATVAVEAPDPDRPASWPPRLLEAAAAALELVVRPTPQRLEAALRRPNPIAAHEVTS